MRCSERSRFPVIRLLSCTLMLSAALPTVLWAGQTRTEQLENERAQRGLDGPPQPQTLGGKVLLFIDKTRLLQPSRPAGSMFYPKFGTVTTGGGIGFGGGYWRSFANDNLFVNASAVLTKRGYRLGRADVALPRLLKHTLELKGYARYRYFTQEDFYGLGPDSAKADRTNYLIEETEYAAQAVWRPRSWLTLASQTARLAPRVGTGTDHHQPSTETRFAEDTAPGLTEQSVFLRTADSSRLTPATGRAAPGAAVDTRSTCRGTMTGAIAVSISRAWPFISSSTCRSLTASAWWPPG